MLKFLSTIVCLCAIPFSALADESVELNGKDYTVSTLIDRDLGPGVRYTRLRIPGYPLNVNMLRIDMTNPYVSVETQQASEKLYSTESLVNGAKRNSSPGHVALAGANANFWCVSPQPPYSDYLIGMTYNGNLKNGKIITETNVKNDQWNGGIKHTGITGVSADGKVYSSNNFSWEGYINSAATGKLEIWQCNKIVRDGELGLYNSFYPTSRSFRCFDQDGSKFVTVPNCATEVYLMLNKESKWSAGNDIAFTVKEIRTKAGDGSIGDYDLALVGRGANADALAKLKVGDEVTVNYSWIDPNGNRVTMTNLVGGNAQVMVDGELTKYNDSETYNSQVYSRTGYGTNTDGTMMYIIVIDKSTDPTYGQSAGCPTSVMCQLAKHYGCVNMTNFDAGGSAMMMVGDKIVNKTTEANPRAVANGMVAFSIAPEDNVVTRLEFYDYELKSPIYATSTPRIIAYNKYGAVVNDNFTEATLSCPAEAGSCDGASFTAGGTGMETQLTATYNGVSVTKTMTIVQTDLSLRLKPLLIDFHRNYPLEVTASVDGNIFVYDPAAIDWTIADESVVKIENGVLSGIKEGTTEVTGTIGDFSDKTTVTVQEADNALVPLDGGEIDPAEWKITNASTKNGVLTPNGANSGFKLDFNISSTRAPKITVAKDITMYSLPDAIEITVNPGEAASVKSVVVTLQPASSKQTIIKTFETTFAASSDTKITVPIDEYADSKDLATYPVIFKSVAFNMNGPAGDTHLEVPSMYAVYNNFTDAVNSILRDEKYNDGRAHYFNLNGVELNGENLAPGVYIKVFDGKAYKEIIK